MANIIAGTSLKLLVLANQDTFLRIRHSVASVIFRNLYFPDWQAIFQNAFACETRTKNTSSRALLITRKDVFSTHPFSKIVACLNYCLFGLK